MKIVCSGCKKVLGEQKPFNDSSEIQAQCLACLAKEKEQALKVTPMPEPGKDREVTFENGLKGILSVAGNETEELSFWDLVVAGKKVFCSEETRKKFQKYLEGITEDEVDVTFFHSMSIKLDKSLGGHRKRKGSAPNEEKKPEGIHYNCTVRVPKQYIQSMFDDKAKRSQQFSEIMAEAVLRMAREERLKSETEKADSSTMSGVLDRTNANSLKPRELGDL